MTSGPVDPATGIVIPAEPMSSQSADSAALKVYPVKPTNFSCRIGVRQGDRSYNEILLTANQLRALATALLARAAVIDDRLGDRR